MSSQLEQEATKAPHSGTKTIECSEEQPWAEDCPVVYRVLLTKANDEASYAQISRGRVSQVWLERDVFSRFSLSKQLETICHIVERVLTHLYEVSLFELHIYLLSHSILQVRLNRVVDVIIVNVLYGC